MLREYCFLCLKEEGGCGHQFSLFINPNDIRGYKAKCEKCKKTKCVIRDYRTEGASVAMEPQTIGMLSAKNTDTFSEDKKQHLLEKNKTKKEGDPIKPRGRN